jgi:predicted nucleic acid-binding protein
LIVVDASLLVAALIGQDTIGEQARHRLVQASAVRAPDLINIETLSGLRALSKQNRLTSSDYTSAVRRLTRLPIDRLPTVSLIERVSELRHNVTPYDAVYVALAEQLQCPLATADRRLANAPGPRCEFYVLR